MVCFPCHSQGVFSPLEQAAVFPVSQQLFAAQNIIVQVSMSLGSLLAAVEQIRNHRAVTVMAYMDEQRKIDDMLCRESNHGGFN